MSLLIAVNNGTMEGGEVRHDPPRPSNTIPRSHTYTHHGEGTKPGEGHRCCDGEEVFLGLTFSGAEEPPRGAGAGS